MMETDGREFCVNFYRMTVEELIAGGVDALIAETMNNWTEVELVLEAASASPLCEIGAFRGRPGSRAGIVCGAEVWSGMFAPSTAVGDENSTHSDHTSLVPG